MHRIDSAGATADNKFTEGDAASGVAATVVTDDWLNATQEEIAHVIEQTGGTLDKLSNTQLWAALSGWFAKGVQATETVLGIAKVATQAQTDAGTDDSTIVTPKKLRMGFAISLGVNSYIVFPSWLGGVTLQFGVQPYGDISVSMDRQITFPLAFPNALRSVVASPDTAQDVTLVVANRLSTGFTAILREGNTDVAGGNVVWFAIGN